MASAKFLEEALSTDVDESAVNAIVGTLETSLVTSTPAGSNTSPSPTPTVQQNHVSSSVIGSRAAPVTKHTVSNGDSLNIVLNQESGKTENAVIPGNFINQVNNCLVQTKDIKLIYPNSQSVNNRVCYVNQSVLPNGIALTSNDTSKGVQTITQAKSDSKPTGTALVIKSSVPSQTSTMTLTSNTNSLVTSTTGVVTLAKPQQIVGGTPQIVPTNVQIVNVNAIRANTPAGTQKAATIPPRVMIRAPVGGTVQPGQITLQALQGLAGGAQGHLLLKTENGQYQLLRVGGAPPTASAGQQTPVSVSGITTNNTFRVQTITNVSTPSAAVQTPVPALTTTTPVATPVRQILGWNVARTVLIAPKPSNKSLPQKSDSCSQKIVQGQQTEHYPDHHDYYYKPGLNNYNHYKAAATVPARTPAVDQTKEKCRKFLANLLELSSREPKTVERNVRTLIQELVDTKVEPEQFCDRLEKLLNASPQPCLIGFLKKSLPLLRQSMVNHEMSIDGIRPPPPNVVFSTASVTPTPTPIRGQVQVAAGTQMRVITQHAALRPGQPIQHRIITPMRMTTATQVAANVNKGTLTTIRAPTVVRPPTQIVRTAAGPTITIRPNQTISKAQFTTRPVLTSNQFNAASKTSLLKQPLSKEKEKKNFSSSGFMGDDDINDVAAMGGVNLAEESQRILGSTEFVGTKIRSCKDDIFLHYGPLMNKMAKIAHKNGLSEPSGDVAALLSHATQERLKNLVEKLAVIAEHRIDLNKSDPRYEITQDVRSQLKCLEEIDKAERKRHEEQERELLLRAAKSRTKPEDPEQAKLKAKAKEMQRAEMEELRQREANVTALLAIGPRKKAKLDDSSGTTLPLSSSTSSSNLQLRPRTKRVCLRDLLILMEQEKDFSRSRLLYKSYFK